MLAGFEKQDDLIRLFLKREMFHQYYQPIQINYKKTYRILRIPAFLAIFGIVISTGSAIIDQSIIRIVHLLGLLTLMKPMSSPYGSSTLHTTNYGSLWLRIIRGKDIRELLANPNLVRIPILIGAGIICLISILIWNILHLAFHSNNTAIQLLKAHIILTGYTIMIVFLEISKLMSNCVDYTEAYNYIEEIKQKFV
jgi:hypothetical protein